MLAKLEQVYLAVLRVVILVAATIALVVAAFGTIGAIPPLIKWAGLTDVTAPTGGTLGEFIREMKASGTSDDFPNTTTTTTVITIQPDINAAATNLKKYLGDRTRLTTDQIAEGLQGFADEYPLHSDAYAKSVRALTEELLVSKGKPLSEARISELLAWHNKRFEADIQLRATEQAEGNSKFLMTIGVAAISFLAFVLIIFIFLFVKIERNLRPVRANSPVEEPSENA